MSEKPTKEAILALSAGKELDALVATHVFGRAVLGYAACWAPDGCWGIFGPAPPGEHSGHAERPVYLRRCYCADRPDLRDRRAVFGHARSCLEVVPEYSSDIAAAWDVVEKMRTRFTNVVLHAANGWGCTLGNVYLDPQSSGSEVVEDYRPAVHGETAPEAVCKAALLAVLGY